MIEIQTTIKNLIQTNFEDEEKILIDSDGFILSRSENNNSKLNLNNHENFLEFLVSKDLTVPNLSTLNSTEKKGGVDFEFFDKKDGNSYRLMIAPLDSEDHSIYLVQIFNVSKIKSAIQKYSDRKKSVENEMLLRTKEIILTDEAMSGDGGFLKNFLRGLRHDLISPITQLKEIIAFYKKTDDPVKKQQSEEFIDLSLNKLTNTANGFSEFVDLHIIKEENKEQLNIESICKEVCNLLKEEIENSKATLSFNFNNTSPLHFNKKMFTSLVYNLLSNAIKFKSDLRPLEIEIRTSENENEIMLEVLDNGIGINLEKYEKVIFEPFKRLNVDRSGAGIGLSLVKNIVDKNDGSIHVNSKYDDHTVLKVKFNK